MESWPRRTEIDPFCTSRRKDDVTDVKSVTVFFDQISLLKIREQKNATNVEQALNVSCAVPGEHDYAPRGFVRVVNRTVRNCIYRGASAPRH